MDAILSSLDPTMFAIGSVGTAIVLFQMKPDFMFTASGKARDFTIINYDQDSTLIPWWLVSLGVGYIIGRLK